MEVEMVVRLLTARRSDDGETNVFVPRGMTGVVGSIEGDKLTVCWDFAFVCNVNEPEKDDEKGVKEEWWDERVKCDDVEFVHVVDGA